MTKQINVLSFSSDLHFGGDENRILALAQSIDRSRFNHVVATINRPDVELDQSFGTMRRQFADAGIEVIDLGEVHSKAKPAIRPVQLARTTRVLSRVVKKLAALVQAHDIDVIDAHTSANQIGILAGVITRKPSVVTIYGHEQRLLPRLLSPVFLGMADAVVTDSHAICNRLKRWMIQPDLKTHVIPNGVSPPSSTRDRAEMMKKLGLPGDPNTQVIGQVSALVPYKGHRILLAAAKSVLEKAPNTAFLLVGYSRDAESYEKDLEKEIAEMGMPDRIRLLNYPGYIGDVWNTIDIHVHASLMDSLPNAIIESMSLAKPAVA
ncbi:MAG TPA: glycosyltransferase family 4 protein, partial [Pyrinomonadaceae bacterium]|nr:glycosyltransferase family 4 protein [Pyrinomonadaceae bacterium]